MSTSKRSFNVWLPGRAPRGFASIRLRQAKYVLGDVREHEVVVHRSGEEETRLAELALDVVLLRECIPAVCVHGRVTRGPCRLRRDQLRHIRLCPAGLAAVEQPCGLVAHEARGEKIGMSLRERELHTLVRADRASEDNALARVARRALDEPPTIAERFGGDEDPLRVPRIDDVAETLSLGPHEGV